MASAASLLGHPCPPQLGDTGWARGLRSHAGQLHPAGGSFCIQLSPEERNQGLPLYLAKGHSVATVTSVCSVRHTWPSHFSGLEGSPPPSEFTLSVESLGDKNMETVAMTAILWSPQTGVQSSGCPGTAEMKIRENLPRPSAQKGERVGRCLMRQGPGHPCPSPSPWAQEGSGERPESEGGRVAPVPGAVSGHSLGTRPHGC